MFLTSEVPAVSIVFYWLFASYTAQHCPHRGVPIHRLLDSSRILLLPNELAFVVFQIELAANCKSIFVVLFLLVSEFFF